MKDIHLIRIDGLVILALIFGSVGGIFFGLYMLIPIVPTIVLWLFNYTEASYDYKFGNRKC